MNKLTSTLAALALSANTAYAASQTDIDSVIKRTQERGKFEVSTVCGKTIESYNRQFTIPQVDGKEYLIGFISDVNRSSHDALSVTLIQIEGDGVRVRMCFDGDSAKPADGRVDKAIDRVVYMNDMENINLLRKNFGDCETIKGMDYMLQDPTSADQRRYDAMIKLGKK